MAVNILILASVISKRVKNNCRIQLFVLEKIVLIYILVHKVHSYGSASMQGQIGLFVQAQ